MPFFLTLHAGMWATRQMLKDPNPQLYVKVTLRELILYCIFMVIISYREAHAPTDDLS